MWIDLRGQVIHNVASPSIKPVRVQDSVKTGGLVELVLPMLHLIQMSAVPIHRSRRRNDVFLCFSLAHIHNTLRPSASFPSKYPFRALDCWTAVMA